MAVSPIVQFLIALIGLGVAIDYSLLVVSRWREERAHGHGGDEAVQRAMESAGRAVVFSGLTVGHRAVRADRAAAAVPALDGLRRDADPARLDRSSRSRCCRSCCRRPAPRLDWPHSRTDDKASRAWTRWAEAVSRRRWDGGHRRAADDRRAGGCRVRRCSSGRRTPRRSRSAGSAKKGLDALERGGHRRGRAAPARDPHRRRDRPGEGGRRRCDGVEGIHGALAPDSAALAPRRDGARRRASRCPTAARRPVAQTLDGRARRRPRRGPGRACRRRAGGER